MSFGAPQSVVLKLLPIDIPAAMKTVRAMGECPICAFKVTAQSVERVRTGLSEHMGHAHAPTVQAVTAFAKNLADSAG